MNRIEFVKILAKRCDLSERKTNQVLEEVKNLVLEVCSKGEDVSLRNFGKFCMQEKPPRRYINPHTMRHYYTPHKKMIAFKGFKNFVYAVNK